MHHPHHAILLLGSLALTSGSPCGPGEAAWPEDGQCHRLNTRGPCPPDQVFLSSARGPRCSSFFDPDEETENSSSNVIHQEKQSKIRTEKTKLDSWTLPMRGQTPSKEESLCLAQEKVSVFIESYKTKSTLSLDILAFRWPMLQPPESRTLCPGPVAGDT